MQQNGSVRATLRILYTIINVTATRKRGKSGLENNQLALAGTIDSNYIETTEQHTIASCVVWQETFEKFPAPMFDTARTRKQ